MKTSRRIMRGGIPWALLGIVVYAICTPLCVNPFDIQPDVPAQGPSGCHWFGTDDLGRDLFSRAALGAQLSLTVGFGVSLLATTFGSVYGLLAAMWGGVRDSLMMRLTELLYSLPLLLVVILLSVWFGRGLPGLILGISLLTWPDTARMVRAQTLQLKQAEFIEAYHSLGGGRFRLITRYLLPNLSHLIILSLVLIIPRAILTESTLSFIGLGVEPPYSSWGTLTSDGWQLIRTAPHLMLIPAALVLLTMWLLNHLADRYKKAVGLNDSLDMA